MGTWFVCPSFHRHFFLIFFKPITKALQLIATISPLPPFFLFSFLLGLVHSHVIDSMPDSVLKRDDFDVMSYSIL